nr:Chain A, LECT2 [Homo sapiens]
GSTVYAPFT